jgi:hypothetical protein
MNEKGRKKERKKQKKKEKKKEEREGDQGVRRQEMTMLKRAKDHSYWERGKATTTTTTTATAGATAKPIATATPIATKAKTAKEKEATTDKGASDTTGAFERSRFSPAKSPRKQRSRQPHTHAEGNKTIKQCAHTRKTHKKKHN